MSFPVPRYYQLREIIREKIANGEWATGDAIPSERILGETYGLSRMTVRQSLAALVSEGFLHREQGRGTFVAQPKMTQQLSNLTSFTEDMEARGKIFTTRVVDKRMCPADDILAAKLRIKEGQSVFRVERLRLADAAPLAVETAYITFIGCERLLDDDLAHSSLYHLLETKYGLFPSEAEQDLEASLADDAQAQALHVGVGAPILLIRRTTFSERNQPFEYVVSSYRGDKYRFHSRLKRERIGVSL